MRAFTALGLALSVLLAVALQAQRTNQQMTAIVAGSQRRPMAALAVGGQATVFSGPNLTAVFPLGVQAYRAYGVSRGWLAFSALQDGFPDERLHVVDLVSGEEQILLREWRVSGAAWRPGHLQLATIGYASAGTSLLLVNVTTGGATPISKRPTSSLGPRWAEDGSALFVVHEVHPADQRSPHETTFLLSRYSPEGSLLAEAPVNPALLPVLAAVDDATLDDLIRQPLGLPWARVPAALHPLGRLGARRPGSSFKQPTILWRMGSTLLVKDTAGRKDVDLYSLNISSGAISAISQ